MQLRIRAIALAGVSANRIAGMVNRGRGTPPDEPLRSSVKGATLQALESRRLGRRRRCA